ncbi:GNAT family protein [Flammeovirga kamogawensis]|uniref:N-end rule aminoacyl transferase C-terminal domain-containing protein n=1 Tax=Flammeovirga kamogawensis TaxID=373891 RepID=A0ABX8GWQ5_9BACT|nr:hypothetical protein [Flammeovirga kamogawensis]MBB6461291.1 arginyl-tRNA--protein-N-Asp/Glu arginylyltransferase [Flammeovirga kamogawensis]QWG07849.1 hypothetical protein KM029_02595 [Flammeovirga kamogawensis]TRX69655.1 hypothetical protein EO216_16530 [Flammeovirga kamogawensis]
MYYDLAFGVISPNDENLAPQKIDELLAKGYFRHAQNMASYEMMFFEEKMQGVLPLRCALTPNMFTKSQRKKINQTEKKFIVEICPLKITKAHKKLFTEYRKKRFNEDDKVLIEYFGVESDQDLDTLPYSTWQISFWYDNQLAAVSYFDVGENAISSLMAIYDEQFKSDGLGFISMLIEMKWAQSNGMNYYYPGYTLDQPSCFDYKLRLPNVEYFDWQGKWKFWDSIDLKSTKRSITLHKLQQGVKEINKTAVVVGYVKEEENFFGSLWHNMFDYTQAVEAPIYISYPIGQFHQMTVIYLPDEDQYLVKPHLFKLKNGMADLLKSNDPIEIANFINAYFGQVQLVETRLNHTIQELKDVINNSNIEFETIEEMGNASRYPNSKWLSCKKNGSEWMIMPFWDDDKQKFFFHPLTFRYNQNRWVSPFGLCTPEMAILKISDYICRKEEDWHELMSEDK